LKRYEEKLREATFNYNRAKGYSSKGKHSTAKKFYNKSESLCEDALEILQEILHSDSTLRVWFDRDISFEVGGELSADIVSLPRLVTSRSHEKLSDDCRLISKQSVKNYPCSPDEQVLKFTQISSNTVLSNTDISVR